MGAYVTLDAIVRADEARARRLARGYRRQMAALPQLPTRHFDNAYVVFDSFDAGRTWNRTPPSLAELDEMDCIPPGEDHQGLGQFGVLQAVATVTGAAFQAGGAVGAALISADAQKYAVKQQTKSEMQIALARAKADLEIAKATVESNVEIAKETTKQRAVESEASTQQVRDVSTGVVPVLGILGIGALAAWIVLKD